jgi:L-asparaginase
MHIIITGGTIDKKYNELTGLVDFASSSYIQSMLTQARLNLSEHTITPLLLKDSLELEQKDRVLILHTIETSPHDKVIITHGTDTMVESANYIAQHLGEEGGNDRVIVFVGAMVPSRFKNSDALFNLGFAMGVAQSLDAGVYIAMNGKIFTHNEVIKNRELGVFEAK